MSGVTSQTIGEVQRGAMKQLRDAGINNPGLDVRLLLAEALQYRPEKLISADRDLIPDAAKELFGSMIAARLSGKPVHRILGHREFYGRRIDFGEGCLEPRPETELLVERILQDIDPLGLAHFLEIGVGSGAIVVTLLSERPQATAAGTDIETKAIAQTFANAKYHDVDTRLELFEADCFPTMDQEFDFIVSNPPYIPSRDIKTLSPEVKKFDPLAALDGGEDGMDIYRKILDHAAKFLKPDGMIYLETGHGQHAVLIETAEKKGWGIVSRHLDLSDLERIVVLNKKENQ